MKKLKISDQLSSEEKNILDAIESGAVKSVANLASEKMRYRKMVCTNKDKLKTVEAVIDELRGLRYKDI